MEDFIYRWRGGAFWLAGKQQGELFRVPAPAFEAGPVTGGERGNLVEEEQFGVAVAPDVAAAAVEIKLAAYPPLRFPETPLKRAIIAVKPASPAS